MSMLQYPRLRYLDLQPITHQGEQMWLLRDPLRITDEQVIMPANLAPILALIDGTRSLPEIHHAFEQMIQHQLDPVVVEDTVATLDSVYLLENNRFHAATHQHLEAYRAQPFRPPALAGLSYPKQADLLCQQFRTYAPDDQYPDNSWMGRGIISPHIDYPRGGDVYAKVWRRVGQALQEAELIIIFGTDHNDGELFTLTKQRYATPFGTLPTDGGLIGQLAQVVGEDVAYADELHHREEHSIELSAVWLHHALGDHTPPPVIPILCGSFQEFMMGQTEPDQDRVVVGFNETLRRETAGKKVVAVASVDFAHVGPNFGDDFPMTQERREQLTLGDKSLIEAVAQGDKTRFYREIADIENNNRICGFAPIYHLLNYLGETAGEAICYQHCSADPMNSSLVSIAGILLT